MGRLKYDVRPLRREDFDAVVGIDETVFGTARPDYYETKFALALDAKDRLVTSLVAEDRGRVVGFVICGLYIGEYGIPASEATLDTIGIHPDFQRKGVGKELITELFDHLKKAGVEKINTLVAWNDWQLIRFFSANRFAPSKTINLEMDLT